MAYINPNTTIYLCSNVPLDPSYDHTFYWSSASSQLAYFKGMVRYTLTKYSYQRVQRGYLRCECVAEDIYDVNYMIFQNTAFGSRWFYAFVDKVEYINDVTSDVYFTIDVMQTWFFDYDMCQCWIDRQHTETDEIGEHTEPEPFTVGDYGNFTDFDSFGLKDTYIGVQVCKIDSEKNVETSDVYVTSIQNIPSGCQLYIYDNDANGVALMTTMLQGFIEAPESVVSIYVFPQAFLSSGITAQVNSNSPVETYIDVQSGYYSAYTFSGISEGDAIGWRIDNQGSNSGYVPRNKKLYTYPFTFLGVTPTTGTLCEFPYECFNAGIPMFALYGSILPTVTGVAYPVGYKSMQFAMSTVPPNINKGVSISGWGYGSWANDAYAEYIASGGGIEIVGGLAKVIASTAAGAATSGVAGAVAGLVTSGASFASNVYSQSVAADNNNGISATGNALLSGNILEMYVAGYSLRQEELERYDTYFDRFGYAISKMDVPNRCARPYWTFLKTTGCTISGSVPADDSKKICDIYNNGITFWNGNATTVLDYSLDNTA